MKSRPNLVDTFRDSIIFRLICFIIVLTAFSGFLIHRLEPFHFTTWFDGIWWSIVTILQLDMETLLPIRR